MRRSVLLLVSVFSAMLLACGAAWAAAGDLDPTFGGGDGQVVGAPKSCPANDLAVLPDSGKIVTAGEYCGRLQRYNPDGSPDDTFGGDGTVTFGHEGADVPIKMEPLAFLVQPDGRMVVGGLVHEYYSGGQGEDPRLTSQFVVARFLPDGTPDEGFGGGDGTVFVRFGEGTSGEATALAMQGDNLVAAGGTSVGTALVRFLPDGTLDASFGGGDGKLTESLGGARDLAVLPDGRLVVAGERTYRDRSTKSGYNSDFFLARFRPDGAFDRSFGGDGKVMTDFGKGTNENATSLAIRGSRTILVGGTRADERKSPPTRFALVAYAEDGSLVKSFGGGDGKVKTVFGIGDAYPRDAIVQEDGRVLVVGGRNKFLKGGRGIDFALARYLPNGTLDASFGGGDGKLVTDVSPGAEDSAAAVATDADGRAVVGGQAIARDSSTNRYELATGLARYLLE